MELPPFSVTWDYRCPFARNAHEFLVAALKDGAPFDVEFVPFTLTQGHLDDGAVPVWDDPARGADLLASRRASSCATTSPTGSSTSTAPCSRPPRRGGRPAAS